MAKYCTKCGEKIENCKCNVKNAKYEEVSTSATKEGFGYIKEVITKPFDAIKNFIEDKSYAGYIFMLLSSVFVGLFASVILFDRYHYMYYMTTGYIVQNVLGMFFKVIILIFALYMLFAFILKLFIELFGKEKIEFKKITNIVGMSSLLIAMYLITLMILLMIGVTSDVVILTLFLAIVIHFSMNVCYGIKESSKIDKNKIPYIYFVSLLVMMCVSMIFIY